MFLCVRKNPLHGIPYSLPIFQESGPTAVQGLGGPELGLGAKGLSGSACSCPEWGSLEAKAASRPHGPWWSHLCFVLLGPLHPFCFPSLKPAQLCRLVFRLKSRCFHRKKGMHSSGIGMTMSCLLEVWQLRPLYGDGKRVLKKSNVKVVSRFVSQEPEVPVSHRMSEEGCRPQRNASSHWEQGPLHNPTNSQPSGILLRRGLEPPSC